MVDMLNLAYNSRNAKRSRKIGAGLHGSVLFDKVTYDHKYP